MENYRVKIDDQMIVWDFEKEKYGYNVKINDQLYFIELNLYSNSIQLFRYGYNEKSLIMLEDIEVTTDNISEISSQEKFIAYIRDVLVNRLLIHHNKKGSFFNFKKE